jgi:hypothetical protein
MVQSNSAASKGDAGAHGALRQSTWHRQLSCFDWFFLSKAACILHTGAADICRPLTSSPLPIRILSTSSPLPLHGELPPHYPRRGTRSRCTDHAVSALRPSGICQSARRWATAVGTARGVRQRGGLPSPCGAALAQRGGPVPDERDVPLSTTTCGRRHVPPIVALSRAFGRPRNPSVEKRRTGSTARAGNRARAGSSGSGPRDPSTRAEAFSLQEGAINTACNPPPSILG